MQTVKISDKTKLMYCPKCKIVFYNKILCKCSELPLQTEKLIINQFDYDLDYNDWSCNQLPKNEY